MNVQKNTLKDMTAINKHVLRYFKQILQYFEICRKVSFHNIYNYLKLHMKSTRKMEPEDKIIQFLPKRP